MDELTRILLHMDLLDTNLLRSFPALHLHMPPGADGQIELRNLISFRQIGIKIILAVKFRIARDIAVERKARAHCIFDNGAV